MLFSPLKTFRKSLAARIRSNRHRVFKKRKGFSSVNTIERLEDRTLLSATIGGSVFGDTNADGVQDSGEVGKPGVTVFLDQNQNNNPDVGELSTVSDSNGNYEFLGLASGTYHIAQQLSNNELQTSPGNMTGPGMTGQVTQNFASPALASIGIALANGSLYLGDRDQDLLFEIDPATGSTISTIALPAGDFWDFTFDGTNLWGVDNLNDTIMKMDFSGNPVSSFPSPGTAPSGITFDGTSLWVSDTDTDTIYEIDPADGSVQNTFSTPNTLPLGLAFDGNHLWLTDWSDDFTYRIDTTNGSVLESFVSPTLGIDPLAGGIEFDNGQLWILQRNEAIIFQVDSGITEAIDVTVSDGDNSTGNSLGNFIAGIVSGTVFEDIDGNGVADAGEGGLEGWRIFIDQNNNGTLDRWESSTITNAEGNYAISNLKPGDHNILQELRQPDWINTASPGNPITILNSGDSITNNDFGNQLDGLGQIGSEIRANGTTNFSGITPRPAVATDAVGNTVVAWSGTGLGATSGVFIQRYDPNGNAVGSEILVNDASSSNGCCPRIAIAAMTGEISVVWGRGNDVLGRIYNADGTPRTNEFTIFQGNAKDRAFPRGLSMDEDGDAVVIMHRVKTNQFSDHFFIFQRFNSFGELQGKAKTVVNVNLSNGEGEIAMDSNGNFVAVWTDSDGDSVIRAQRYDSNGRAQGQAFDVAVEGADRSVLGTSIAMKSTGEFVVSWFRTFNDGVVVQEAQIFEATGSFRGSGLSLGGSQSSQVDAAFLPNGDLFFTWHLGNDILGRRFKSDGTGTPVDLEPFRVNTTIDPVPIPGVPSRNPHVASDANGNLSVVWVGLSTVDDLGVYMQRFANSTTAPPLTPGITITPISGLVTTEAGGSDSFSIVLDAAPTTDVTIGISSSDTTEGNVSTSSLTFTAANWDTPQTVTVSGVDDAIEDGEINYTIVTAAATSADAGYNGLNAADVSVVNQDDDAAGINVTGLSPDSAARNQQVTVTVIGSGFVNGATANFGNKVNVQSVTFVSSTQLDVLIKVHKRAATGSRDVTITNPDSSSATLSGGFTVTANLLAETTGDSDGIIPLTQNDAETIAEFALQLWIGVEGSFELPNFNVIVADLPGNQLGMASGNVITLDVDAAGVGWFIDTTPYENSEFANGVNGYDLLTAAAHEIGHLLGFDHEHDGVMAETLSVGERHLPGEGEALADESPVAPGDGTFVIPMYDSSDQDDSTFNDSLGTGIITSPQPLAEKSSYAVETNIGNSLTNDDFDSNEPVPYIPEEELDPDSFFSEFADSLLDNLLALS